MADKKTALDREGQKRTVRRLLGRMKRHRAPLFLSLLAAACSVAGALYVPILIGGAIDCLLGPGDVAFGEVARALSVVALVTAATALSQWLMNVCNNRITFQMTRDVRDEAMAKICVLPLCYIDSHAHGDVVSRVIADVDQFADGLLMGFTQFFTGVLTIVGTLGFIFSIDSGIALIVVCLTPISLFVARFIAGRTFSMFKLQSEARGEQTALIEEMISGQKVVKAFAYEREAGRRFDEVNERLKKYSLRAIFFSSITNPSTRFVNSLVYAAVALAGALAAIGGALTVGQLACLLSYANQYTKPFNEISGVITELQNALACAARIFELIDEPAQTPDAPNAVRLQRPSGAVALEDVSFSYVPERRLIENFSLAVEPGQRVAIVGPTGCGKTTIINLLMRFYDADSGRITVDGMSVRDITRKSLRGAYGMVLQDTWLKNGTVRENITMGSAEYTEEQIIDAARRAHSYGFISRMPRGLDTVISDDGALMSQGEKQLLCITRVMLRLPAMLILDEATSSIDTRTELKIQSAFSRMMEGRTSFIVAHRLSTIQTADVILVMRDGRVVEQGRHEELLARDGFYAELYNSQFAG